MGRRGPRYLAATVKSLTRGAFPLSFFEVRACGRLLQWPWSDLEEFRELEVLVLDLDAGMSLRPLSATRTPGDILIFSDDAAADRTLHPGKRPFWFGQFIGWTPFSLLLGPSILHLLGRKGKARGGVQECRGNDPGKLSWKGCFFRSEGSLCCLSELTPPLLTAEFRMSDGA